MLHATTQWPALLHAAHPCMQALAMASLFSNYQPSLLHVFPFSCTNNSSLSRLASTTFLHACFPYKRSALQTRKQGQLTSTSQIRRHPRRRHLQQSLLSFTSPPRFFMARPQHETYTSFRRTAHLPDLFTRALTCYFLPASTSFLYSSSYPKLLSDTSAPRGQAYTPQLFLANANRFPHANRPVGAPPAGSLQACNVSCLEPPANMLSPLARPFLQTTSNKLQRHTQ